MTQPGAFTTVTEPVDEDREYIPMARCKGRLLIVRPLEYQREGFTTKHKPDGTDVVFADIAVLDEIPSWSDEYGVDYQGFPAGHQFRNQAILQGYLKGTFKRYIGQTLLGTIYFGPPTKGKPPMMWQDLSSEKAHEARGVRFMAAFPDFLIPVTRQIAKVEEPQYGPSSHQRQAAPASAGRPDPWASADQPDPWVPVEPLQAAAAPAVTTLDQMRQMTSGAGGGSSDIPF